MVTDTLRLVVYRAVEGAEVEDIVEASDTRRGRRYLRHRASVCSGSYICVYRVREGREVVDLRALRVFAGGYRKAYDRRTTWRHER